MPELYEGDRGTTVAETVAATVKSRPRELANARCPGGQRQSQRALHRAARGFDWVRIQHGSSKFVRGIIVATTCAGLVGREEELAAIVGFLEAARDGPSTLLLEGEAGIGKSTLWSAGVAAARESKFCVLTARPAPAEAALSYAGLADLMDGHLDVLGELPEPQRHALEVVLLLAEPAGLPPDQRAIGAGLLNALRLLANEGPVLIGVDDISWLDAASLAVVEFVARRLRNEPVGLLLTHRNDPLSSLRLEDLSSEGGVGRLLVGPLGVDGLYRVLHKELGVVFAAGTAPHSRRGSRESVLRARAGSCGRAGRAGTRTRRAGADPRAPSRSRRGSDRDVARRDCGCAVRSCSAVETDGRRR